MGKNNTAPGNIPTEARKLPKAWVSHPCFRRSGAPIILKHFSGCRGCDSSCDSTRLRRCSSSCQSSWARQLPSSDSPKISRLSSTSLLSLPSKCFAFPTPGSLLKSLFLPKKQHCIHLRNILNPCPFRTTIMTCFCFLLTIYILFPYDDLIYFYFFKKFCFKRKLYVLCEWKLVLFP